MFFRGNHKVEDACEMYARAANMFKMAKNWSGMNDSTFTPQIIRIELMCAHQHHVCL